MVLVTLQLGQAGNQLGHQLFEALSAELRSEQGEGLSPAAASFFYQAQVGGETRCARGYWCSRAVHRAQQESARAPAHWETS